MALQLVALISIFTVTLHAEGPMSWRDGIIKKYQKNNRITFGEAIMSGDEVKAINSATSAARAELAKTFSLRISAETNHFSSYQQSNEKSDSIGMHGSSILRESTDYIELAGVDTSNINIDRQRNIIEVAAILDLDAFKRFLFAKIAGHVAEIEPLNKSQRCNTLNDLRRRRKSLQILNKAGKYNDLLGAFTEKNLVLQTISQSNAAAAINCRNKFSVIISGLDTPIQAKLMKIARDEGFLLVPKSSRLPADHQKIQIVVKKIFSEPQVVFERSNITANAEITLITGAEKNLKTSTVTLRQVSTDAISARAKIDVRLDDEIIKGVKGIIEDNL